MTRENGKHLDEARGEVRRGIEVVELAAGMTTLMKGETLDQVARGVDVSMHRFPLGVCCGITPFNFPAMIPLWFAPLAIAAGNTFVLKPSQRTPLTANRLAELFAEAGFPDGVFNVVHGAQHAVEALIDHPRVRAVSFVGSAPVARKVYERSGLRGKRVQALAGAKNHLVVMPDADLDLAVPAVFASAFSNAGQRCLAGSVAVGVGAIGDELVAGLSRMAQRGARRARRRTRHRRGQHDHAGHDPGGARAHHRLHRAGRAGGRHALRGRARPRPRTAASSSGRPCSTGSLPR